MVASNIDISVATPALTELVSRATEGQEIITLTAEDDKSAVLLSLEAFEYLVGLQKYQQRELLPPEQFEQQFHQTLVDSGYDSRAKIIDLVQSVKEELYDERRQKQ
ncbi:MAG: hypothetical protein AAGN15_23010 [Cyanobacteria bacterium J06581_3]